MKRGPGLEESGNLPAGRQELDEQKPSCCRSEVYIRHVSSTFRPCKEISPIMTHSAQVKPSTSVRDLGIVIDRHLTMHELINVICRNASLPLRRIGKIRSFLTKATTEILVHAFGQLQQSPVRCPRQRLD